MPIPFSSTICRFRDWNMTDQKFYSEMDLGHIILAREDWSETKIFCTVVRKFARLSRIFLGLRSKHWIWNQTFDWSPTKWMNWAMFSVLSSIKWLIIYPFGFGDSHLELVDTGHNTHSFGNPYYRNLGLWMTHKPFCLMDPF